MSNEVRSQDTVFVISSVASSKLGRDLAWNYFKDNWDLFNERFKGAFLLVRLVKSLTENFASEEKAVEIEHFFKVWLNLNYWKMLKKRKLLHFFLLYRNTIAPERNAPSSRALNQYGWTPLGSPAMLKLLAVTWRANQQPNRYWKERRKKIEIILLIPVLSSFLPQVVLYHWNKET